MCAFIGGNVNMSTIMGALSEKDLPHESLRTELIAFSSFLHSSIEIDPRFYLAL
jgi:hypothetical protein